jgi:hypothetical protein
VFSGEIGFVITFAAEFAAEVVRETIKSHKYNPNIHQYCCNLGWCKSLHVNSDLSDRKMLQDTLHDPEQIVVNSDHNCKIYFCGLGRSRFGSPGSVPGHVMLAARQCALDDGAWSYA